MKTLESGKYIIVEGLIGAGKTTLVNFFNNEENNIVKEYKDFVGGHKNFPEFPYISSNQAQQSVDFFVNLELNRHKSIKDNFNNTIFDRSLLSILAFTYANRVFDNNYYDVYNYSISKFSELYETHKLKLPNVGLYLKINYEESIRRRRQRGTYIQDHFADKKFNNKLIEFYDHFSKYSNNFIQLDGYQNSRYKYALSTKIIREKAIEEIIDVFNIADKLN